MRIAIVAAHWRSLFLGLVLAFTLSSTVSSSFAATPLPASMLTPRKEFALVTANDGKLYAIGGYSSEAPPTVTGAVEAYDATTNTWTARADLPTPRWGLAAAASADGKIYTIGGFQTGPGYVGTVEVYDPPTNTWSTKASMPTARARLAATRGPDGKIYAIGGQEAPTLSTVEAYDPTLDSWASVASMSMPRRDLAAVTASNGEIYAIGGVGFPAPTVLATVERYDVVTDTWTPRASMAAARMALAAVAVTNGKIYAFGGMGGCITPSCMVTAVEEYDPGTNAWVTRQNMATPRAYHGAAQAGNGKIYTAGGFSNGVPPSTAALTSVDEYDPATDTWRPDRVAPMVTTLFINFGAAVTSSTAVTLTLSATDNLSNLADMSFSNDGTTWGPWQPFATQAAWTLSNGDGQKTVHARVRDLDGNVSATKTATITLDTASPISSLTINGGAPATNVLNVALTLAALDPASGVADMSFSNTNDGIDWSPWELFAATRSAWPMALGSEGPRTVYVRVRDEVGNISSAFNDTILYETAAPTVTSLTINSGALATTSTSANLTIQATDTGGSGVSQMAFSNDGGATWSAWETFASTKAWILSSGNGPKTVLVRVRDAAGNVSSPASDTITLDTSPGTSFSVSINSAAVWTNTFDVTLSLGAAPGTARMMISNDGGFPGATWEPYASTKANWILDRFEGSPVTMIVYVRFGDANGNELPNSRSSDNIVLDIEPPTGSVSVPVPGGATPSEQAVSVRSGSGPITVQSPVQTVQLTATDTQSGSAMQMRLSNRADFAGAIWKPFAGSVSWDFTGGGTVYAQFKDGAGNLSQVYSQSLAGGPGAGTSPTPKPKPR